MIKRKRIVTSCFLIMLIVCMVGVFGCRSKSNNSIINNNAKSTYTEKQQSAINNAKQKISSGNGLSSKELLEALQKDGYTKDEAQFAIDNCGASWKEEAVKRAKYVLEKYNYWIGNNIPKTQTMQMLQDYFTKDEIDYAKDKLKDTWKEVAYLHAKHEFDYGLRLDELKAYLLEDKSNGVVDFTSEEVEYAIKKCGTFDDKEQALKRVKSLSKYKSSYNEILDKLISAGFSSADATEALDKSGIE